jgi:hypothetical protein
MQDISHHVLRGYKLYLKGRDLTSVAVNDYNDDGQDLLRVVRPPRTPPIGPNVEWDRTPEPRREIEVLDRTEVCAVLYRLRLALLRGRPPIRHRFENSPLKRLRNSEADGGAVCGV